MNFTRRSDKSIIFFDGLRWVQSFCQMSMTIEISIDVVFSYQLVRLKSNNIFYVIDVSNDDGNIDSNAFYAQLIKYVFIEVKHSLT